MVVALPSTDDKMRGVAIVIWHSLDINIIDSGNDTEGSVVFIIIQYKNCFLSELMCQQMMIKNIFNMNVSDYYLLLLQT